MSYATPRPVDGRVLFVLRLAAAGFCAGLSLTLAAAAAK